MIRLILLNSNCLMKMLSFAQMHEAIYMKVELHKTKGNIHLSQGLFWKDEHFLYYIKHLKQKSKLRQQQKHGKHIGLIVSFGIIYKLALVKPYRILLY